ncbi:MAG: hypothetical protein ACLURV_05710 [Gallintestinimicrobium sp.]
MKQGKIVMDGSCQEVLGDSRALRTIGLLGSEAAQTAELLLANGVLPEAAKRRAYTCASGRDGKRSWKKRGFCRAAGFPVLMRRCGTRLSVR